MGVEGVIVVQQEMDVGIQAGEVQRCLIFRLHRQGQHLLELLIERADRFAAVLIGPVLGVAELIQPLHAVEFVALKLRQRGAVVAG